jgi:hypothetical protein
VEWTTVQRHRCREPTIQAREDYGDGFADDDRPATIYPAPPRLNRSIPANVRHEWEEAQKCRRANHIYVLRKRFEEFQQRMKA